MKKSKFFLLSLISLSLVGCGPTASTTSSSEAPIDPTTTSTPTKDTTSTPDISTTPDISSTPELSTPDVSTPDVSTPDVSTPDVSTPDVTSSDPASSEAPLSTSSSEEPESTSSSANPYASGWKRATVDVMLDTIGDVIPYVNIGRTESADWTPTSYSGYGYLMVEGSNKYDATMETSCVNAYTAAGWTITSHSATKFEAKDDTKGLKVLIKNDDSDWVTIKVDYVEPYDPTTEDAWGEDLQDEMTDVFGSVVTYVYLGTRHETYSFSSYSNSLTIVGGRWNAQVITDATDTLTTDGWTIDTSKTNATTVVATKTDQNTLTDFTFKITKYGSTYPYIEGTITWKEGWNPTGTAWPQEILDAFDDNLDGHQIPFFYIGTANPTASYSSYSQILELEGGAWDARVIDQARTAFANDKTAAGDPIWTETSNSTGDVFEVEAEMDDGCKITVKVFRYTYDDTIEVDIKLQKGFVIPATATAWSADTLTLIAQKIGHDIPYVYLNTIDETASWGSNTDGTYLTIVGDAFNDALLPYADTVFAADTKADPNDTDWTASAATADFSLDYWFKGTVNRYEKTFANGDKVVVKVGQGYSTPYPCRLEIHIEKAVFEVPATATGWSQDTQDLLNDKIGHNIPYVWLCSDDEVASEGSNSYEGNYIQILGDAIENGFFEYAQDVFANAPKDDPADTDWLATSATADYSMDYYYKETVYKFVKTFANGDVVTVKIGKSYSSPYAARMQVHIVKPFAVPTDPAACVWSDDVITGLDAAVGASTNVPFVYLGTDAPTFQANNYSIECPIIEGGKWDDQIIDLADEAFVTNGGYVKLDAGDCYYSSYGADKLNVYYNETTDIALILHRKNNRAYIAVYNKSNGQAVTPAPDADWPTGIQTNLTNNLGGLDLPVLDLGATPTGAFSSTDKTLTISGGAVRQTAYYIAAYNAFKTAGYEDVVIGIGGYGLEVHASYTTSAGKYTITMKANYSSIQLLVKFESLFVVPTDPEDCVWSDAVNTAVTAKTNTDENIVPFFYLGADKDDLTTSAYTYEVDVKGGTWDDQIFTLAITALEEANDDITDDDQKWTHTFYQTSPTGTKYLHASRAYTDKDGNAKRVTLSLYKNYSGLPVLEIYVI